MLAYLHKLLHLIMRTFLLCVCVHNLHLGTGARNNQNTFLSYDVGYHLIVGAAAFAMSNGTKGVWQLNKDAGGVFLPQLGKYMDIKIMPAKTNSEHDSWSSYFSDPDPMAFLLDNVLTVILTLLLF